MERKPMEVRFIQEKELILDGIRTGYTIKDTGEIRNKHGKIMKATPHYRSGYLEIRLSINGKKRNCQLHRLVAITFIPNPENKPEVNHIDGDKQNPDVSNLEWVTKEENMQHAVKTGLMIQAEDCSNTKYTNEQIKNVCKLLDENKYTLKEISNMTGVAMTIVDDVRSGKTWKSISEGHEFLNRPKRERRSVTEEKDLIVELILQGVQTKKILEILGREYTDTNRRVISRAKKELMDSGKIGHHGRSEARAEITDQLKKTIESFLRNGMSVADICSMIGWENDDSKGGKNSKVIRRIKDNLNK